MSQKKLAKVRPVKGEPITITHPDVAQRWSTLNPIPASMVDQNHSYLAIWDCMDYINTPHAHTYTDRVSSQTKLGRGCPVCAGKSILKGFNDFASNYPHLVPEWSSENELHPDEVTKKSGKSVKWVCSDGHEWVAKVSTRANGHGCAICSKYTKSGGNTLHITHPTLMEQWSEKNSKKISEVTAGSRYRASWCCLKDGEHPEWISPVYDRTGKETGCPVCSNKVSKPERRIKEFLQKNLNDSQVLSNVRDIISPFELDIYVPDFQLAVEFNDLYWHSEEFKSRNYHRDKYLACKDKGIRLIQVWEDDWRDRREIVERMLLRKLGVSSEKTVYARSCTIKSVSLQESNIFLTKNHIQGAASGSVRLGLFNNDSSLVALTVLSKRGAENEWTLERYASTCKVPGGHSKLLSYFQKNFSWKTIKTFADLTLSDGDLYVKTGWKVDKTLAPDYMYVVNGRRVHKFNYRRAKFSQDHNLTYVEEMSEQQMAKLNGIPRVYDAGKIKYIVENEN